MKRNCVTKNNLPDEKSRRARGVCIMASLLAILWTVGFLFATNQNQNVLALNQIKPGMKGIGKTVFHGDKVEECQVDILGVLETIAPKQTAILAELLG